MLRPPREWAVGGLTALRTQMFTYFDTDNDKCLSVPEAKRLWRLVRGARMRVTRRADAVLSAGA